MTKEEELQGRVDDALDMAYNNAQYDGSHHKMWVIDQMVRILAGDEYELFVSNHNDGEDGEDTYSWDTGIAP